MPEPKIHIKEAMAESTKRTLESLPEDHYLVTNIGGLYLEVMVLVEELKELWEDEASKLAMMGLGVRNFRLFQCASHCIYNGFYEAAMALLRISHENNLLMIYLTGNEKEATKWLEGKRFKPSQLKEKVEDKTKWYGFLSNWFTHTNVESVFSIAVTTKNGKKFSMKYFPQFDIKLAKICFKAWVITAWMSLIALQYAFRGELWEREEWSNRFAEWNGIVLDYVERTIISKQQSQKKKEKSV